MLFAIAAPLNEYRGISNMSAIPIMERQMNDPVKLTISIRFEENHAESSVVVAKKKYPGIMSNRASHPGEYASWKKYL